MKLNFNDGHQKKTRKFRVKKCLQVVYHLQQLYFSRDISSRRWSEFMSSGMMMLLKSSWMVLAKGSCPQEWGIWIRLELKTKTGPTFRKGVASPQCRYLPTCIWWFWGCKCWRWASCCISVLSSLCFQHQSLLSLQFSCIGYEQSRQRSELIEVLMLSQTFRTVKYKFNLYFPHRICNLQKFKG